VEVPTAYTYTFSPSVWLSAGTQFWVILQAVPPTSRAGNVYALFYYNNGTSANSLWRSDGEGKIWTKALCNNPWSVANPGLSYSVLLAAGGYVFAEFAYSYEHLCRSSDGGDNFAACYPPDSGNCMSLVAQPGGSTIAMLGDGSYFWTSSDYGTTWGPHTTIPWAVTRLYWPYANRLYALGSGGIATSADGGLTWTLLRYHNTAGGNQILALYFPPDPANPPWASTSSGNTLLRGQMVNGAWNGCFEGETWVDPLSNTVPAGTPTNFRPSTFTGNSVQWVIFHDDRMIVMGVSALTPTALYTDNVNTTTNTLSGGVAAQGWVKGTKVRYRAGGGSPVGGLQDGQDYYVTNVVGTTSIQLATTLADAMAGTPVIDLTTTGNNAQTLSVSQAGIATTPIAYATAGTPVWTYPEIDRGLDFDHGHMDPNNHAYIWAMTGSTDGNASNIGGVWRSLDGGQTWSPANTGIEKYSGNTSIYGAPLIVSADTPVPGPLIPVVYGGSGQYKYHFMSDGNPYVTVSITGNGTTATVTTTAPHLLPDGNTNVTISGTGNSNLDGLRVATKIDDVTFTFPSTYNGSSISGKMSYWRTYNM
jgi:hypothetical protein